MRIGFIGVGHLGRHLAASLLRAGFPLVVHDLHKDAAADLIASGAAWASSPKDLLLAHQLGRDFGVPLELAGLVEQIFIRARSQYGGSVWSTMVVKLLEDALGVELRAPGFPDVLAL